VALALVIVLAAAYLLRRLGVLRFGKTAPDDAMPPSTRMRRP
jgi:hypothetical protein